MTLGRENPEFRLQGFPLPYNPDLTVAYPFRLGVVYQKTFQPDIIYLASPASGRSLVFRVVILFLFHLLSEF